MNKQNFQQTGGFPLETNTLDAMQTAYNLFNALGAIAGNKAIIKGCDTVGSTVTDGVVYLDGEVYEFRGGNSQATVRVIEEAESKQFEDGNTKDVHFTRYVTFASGAGSIPWSDFKRANTLLELSSRILPPGTNPQLYTGAINDIPNGWQLCDGTNNTPDLRGKFIVGYHPGNTDYNTIGNTGGEKEVQLQTPNLPAHNHGGATSTQGNHSHTVYLKKGENDAGNSGKDLRRNIETGESTSVQTEATGAHSHLIQNEGDGQPHENRPPYFTLAYIIYTGN